MENHKFKEYVEALYETYKKGIIEIPCDTDELKKELFVTLIEDAFNQIVIKTSSQLYTSIRNASER